MFTVKIRIHPSCDCVDWRPPDSKRNRIRASFTLKTLLLAVAAVKMVSGDDHRTVLRTLIGIVAALDARTGTAGFDELNAVLVTQTNAAPGASLRLNRRSELAIGAGCVPKWGRKVEQLTLGVACSSGSLSSSELNAVLEVQRKFALLRRVHAGGRAICFRSTACQSRSKVRIHELIYRVALAPFIISVQSEPKLDGRGNRVDMRVI